MRIIPQQELPMIQLDSQKFGIDLPKEMKEQQSDEIQFQYLLQLNVFQITKEIKWIAEKKKREMSKKFKLLKSLKMEKYDCHFVNRYLDIYQQIKNKQSKSKNNHESQIKTLPLTLKSKFDAIQEKQREYDIQILLTVLDDYYRQTQDLLDECQQKLKKEEIDDKRSRNQYGEEWNDIVESSIASISYKEKIQGKVFFSNLT